MLFYGTKLKIFSFNNFNLNQNLGTRIFYPFLTKLLYLVLILGFRPYFKDDPKTFKLLGKRRTSWIFIIIETFTPVFESFMKLQL